MYLNEYESELVHAYIVLPFARKVLERDLKIITSSKYFKIKEPYINFLTAKLDKLSLKLRDVKREMKQLKIFVSEINRNEKEITYTVRCRGYVFDKRYFNDVMKKHVERALNELFENE